MWRVCLVFKFVIFFSLNQVSLCQDSQYPYQDYHYQLYGAPKNNFYNNNYRPYYNGHSIISDYYKNKNLLYPSTSLAYRSGFSDFNEVASTTADKISSIGNEVRSRLKQVENVASNIKKLTNDLTVVTHGVDAVADGTTNIAQRGLFDSGLSDVLSMINEDFNELKDSLADLLTAIGNDIRNVFSWMFSFPGFGLWTVIKHFANSFMRGLQFFPRVVAHAVLPKSMDSYFRRGHGINYLTSNNPVNSPVPN